MALLKTRNYFSISIFFHVGVLALLTFSMRFASNIPVLENTNHEDIISAVVLGDSPKSKVITDPLNTPPPLLKAPPKVAPIKPPQEAKKDAIPLKVMPPKKKIIHEKPLAPKKKQEVVIKKRLPDTKQLEAKKQKIKELKMKSQFEKTLREQSELSLRQQLLNEEVKLQAKRERLARGDVDKYKALILQAISEHWIVPPQVDKHKYCMLMIHLAPGGTVLEVEVTRSSGDPSLDSSVRAAVMKASPLPVPINPDAFEPFRQFMLKVKPENIMGASRQGTSMAALKQPQMPIRSA